MTVMCIQLSLFLKLLDCFSYLLLWMSSVCRAVFLIGEGKAAQPFVGELVNLKHPGICSCFASSWPWSVSACTALTQLTQLFHKDSTNEKIPIYFNFLSTFCTCLWGNIHQNNWLWFIGVWAQLKNRAVDNTLAEYMTMGLQETKDYFPFQLTSK